MKKGGSNKKWTLGLATLFSALLFAPAVMAAQKFPHVKISNGDTFIGGWFHSPETQTAHDECQNDNARYQAPSSDATAKQAGVLAFATNQNNGSASDNAVFSLGSMESGTGVTGTQYGFATGNGPSINSLSFSNNQTVTSWGGLYDGTTKQTYCIPDYFNTKKRDSTTPWDSGTTTISNAFPTQYFVQPGNNVFQLNTGDETIDAGKNLTIFVEGNVYIGGNITYSNYDVDHIPKFALVVKGSIYIGPHVDQLDGLYIAQPNIQLADPVHVDTGDIWTCHDENPAAPTTDWIGQKCDNKNLTINGALIAKEVKFLRTKGDSGGAPAETINYTPAMILGGPFFNPIEDPTLKVQSLISLPPVF